MCGQRGLCWPVRPALLRLGAAGRRVARGGDAVARADHQHALEQRQLVNYQNFCVSSYSVLYGPHLSFRYSSRVLFFFSRKV